jgi:hypothetical protein
MNRIVVTYLLFAVVACLFLPDNLGLASAFRLEHARLPIYSWIDGVTGLSPFYEDYFFLMWLSMPVWLVIFAWVYIRNYKWRGDNYPALIFVWFMLIGILALMLMVDIDIESSNGSWRQQLIAAAARRRIVGSIIFPPMLLFVYLMAALSIVKIPADLIRR